jgi:hypothetical protein
MSMTSDMNNGHVNLDVEKAVSNMMVSGQMNGVISSIVRSILSTKDNEIKMLETRVRELETQLMYVLKQLQPPPPPPRAGRPLPPSYALVAGAGDTAVTTALVTPLCKDATVAVGEEDSTSSPAPSTGSEPPGVTPPGVDPPAKDVVDYKKNDSPGDRPFILVELNNFPDENTDHALTLSSMCIGKGGTAMKEARDYYNWSDDHYVHFHQPTDGSPTLQVYFSRYWRLFRYKRANGRKCIDELSDYIGYHAKQLLEGYDSNVSIKVSYVVPPNAYNVIPGTEDLVEYLGTEN